MNCEPELLLEQIGIALLSAKQQLISANQDQRPTQMQAACYFLEAEQGQAVWNVWQEGNLVEWSCMEGNDATAVGFWLLSAWDFYYMMVSN